MGIKEFIGDEKWLGEEGRPDLNDMNQAIAYIKQLQTELAHEIDMNAQGRTKMDMDDLIDQFVTDLDFDVLIIWADILDIEHDEDMWLDDMWPDCESELRQKVCEAMGNIGRKNVKSNP